MSKQKNNVSQEDENPEQYDMTDFRRVYEMSWPDKIEKIYEVPKINDMAGVIARGIFRNDRQLNAILRLAHRHQKFGDKKHQELLRMKIIGTAAIGGVARLEALFAGTNLIAADMYRVARNMPKVEKGKEEKVYRGSDFRKEENPNGHKEVIP